MAPPTVGSTDWQSYSLAEILSMVGAMDHGAVSADAESIRVAAQNVANSVALFRRLCVSVVSTMAGESVMSAFSEMAKLSALIDFGVGRADQLHGAMSQFGSILGATRSEAGLLSIDDDQSEVVREVMRSTYSAPLIAGNAGLPTESYHEGPMEKKLLEYIPRSGAEVPSTAMESVATSGISPTGAIAGGADGTQVTGVATPADQAAQQPHPAEQGLARTGGGGQSVDHRSTSEGGDRAGGAVSPLAAPAQRAAAPASGEPSTSVRVTTPGSGSGASGAMGGLLNIPTSNSAAPRPGPSPSGNARPSVTGGSSPSSGRATPLSEEAVGRRPLASTISKGGPVTGTGTAASGGGRAGGPMGTTGAGGRSGRSKGHRAPDYLRGTDNASDVIGTLPLVVPPVIGTISPPATPDVKK